MAEIVVRPFKLAASFLDQFQGTQPNWGPIGYITCKRTYARTLEDGSSEEYWQICQRVVEGVYDIQKEHCRKLKLPWDNAKAQRSAQEMFRRMWEFKWLPPGRGLWMMGTKHVDKVGSAALNNCGFTSTVGIKEDLADPFAWLMDMLMLGVGVGFDTKGAGLVKIADPRRTDEPYVVEDSREGWVDLLRAVILPYSGKGSYPTNIDYTLIRLSGTPIKGFGGTASGPAPLMELVSDVSKILDARIGHTITSTDIVDLCNLVGRCVVAGNVRRCLPEGVLVHTERGLIKIENVSLGDKVLTSGQHGDLYSEVTEIMNQGAQDLLHVTTKMGTMECTANHRVAVLTSPTEYLFKTAEALVPGDRLVFVDDVVPGSKTSLPPWTYEYPKHSTTCAPITIPELDTGMAWWLGYLFGDGYVAACRDQAGFNARVSIPVANDEYRPDIEARLRSGYARFGAKTNDILPTEHDNCLKIRSQSKQLASYLDQNFKQPKTPLQVPDCILQATPEIRASFVAGVLDAGGSVKTRPVNLAASVYLPFLEQLRTVYASLGIVTSLRQCRAAFGTWQALYSLNLVGELEREKFEERVAPYSVKQPIPGRTQRSTGDSGYLATWVPVGWRKKPHWSRSSAQVTQATYKRLGGVVENLVPVTVMAVGPGRAGVQTYDLSVRGAQEFVVNGLLVHNSAEIAFGDPEDEAFRELKNPLVAGDALLHHRWSSNNSIFAKVGMDYTEAAARTAVNGEPGFEWLANAQAYSRMGREPDHRDRKAAGGNPCIVGSTRIAVADGRHAVPIKQLVDEGKDVPVYSLDPTTGQMSVKWARNPRLTRKDASLVRVHLDDGTHVDCTPEHKWYLRDCTWKEAKDLLPGDSLSTFSKKQEVMTSGGNKYWQVETNTADPHAARSRVMEHRLIAKFCDPDTFNAKHSLEKHNGWVNGGLVVHHKNYNSLDNSPSNLQWMTFTEHTKHHADFDRVGENNGMFGREHSEETKRKIGDKTLERTQSAEFCAKLSASHTLEERSELSVRMTEQKAEWDKAYYLEQEAQTDLDTVWVGEQMFARKVCELCTTSFVVPWGKRDRVHCSTRCSQLWLAGMDKRKNNQRQYFADKQKSTLHDQVMVFKDLEKSQGSVPLKKAWAGACREKGVSFRLRPEGSESNTSVLRSFGHLKEVAAGYNDRVAHVEILSHVADVYCLTVDDNHTMSIIPEGRDTAKCLKSLNISNCLEQTLEDRELCCLVETFPSLHENYEDYEKTLKYAYLYAKSVTLVPTHDERTNMVMQRNRRIGASMSGIVQAMQRHGTRNFLNMCDQGYSYLRSLDESYSDWLCVRQSIKITSVKPSGTVSLLAGVTPGIHYPHSKFYIRRIRFQANSPLVSLLEQCGHKTELDQYSPNTVCVEFPIKEEYFDRGKDEVSMWEQLELAAQIQHYWADNQVSVTVTFKAEEASAIKRALELYETRLKGVSFLPIKDHGYVQAPMETITEEQYNAMAAKLRPMLSLDAVTNEVVERFCDGDVCVVQ